MSKYRNFLFISLLHLVLVSCKGYYHIADTKTSSDRIQQSPDSVVANLVAPYKSTFEAQMHGVLAHCPESMTKAKPESTLTNWVADALYNQATKKFAEPIAFAFQNYGGIRINNLGQGPVTLGTLFEIMPFDNAFILIKLSGVELKKLLKYIAVGGGLPVSSSLSMVISEQQVISAAIHGQAIVDQAHYYVGMTDYLANGGDNLDFLTLLPRIDQNLLVRDMLIDEAFEKKVMASQLDQRIIIKK